MCTVIYSDVSLNYLLILYYFILPTHCVMLILQTKLTT